MKVTLKERVQLGIAFIKGAYGPNALTKIDAQTLALNDGTACVLGQLGGEYGKEVHKLRLDRSTAYLFGLIVTPKFNSLPYAKERRAVDALNRAWKREIHKVR